MNWKGKRVLITGAAGFIGSHLTETLVRAGARVRALDLYNSNNDWTNLGLLPDEIRNEVEVVLSDLRDPFAMRTAVLGREIVFHLAALIGIPYSYVAPQSYVETNVTGTLNILEACRSEGIERLVHTSTSEVYGTARYTPIDEAHPMQGQSPYSATKIAADKLAESYYLSYGLPVVTARPFNTFGPRQSARAIIPTVISQGLKNHRLKLGNLAPRRDLNYVADTCEGLMALAAAPKACGEVVNLGYGKDISIGELVDLIGEVLGVEFAIETDDQRVRPDTSEVMRLMADNKKAMAIAGWEPRHNLREGLAQTLDWIRRHQGRFKPELYNV